MGWRSQLSATQPGLTPRRAGSRVLGQDPTALFLMDPTPLLDPEKTASAPIPPIPLCAPVSKEDIMNNSTHPQEC